MRIRTKLINQRIERLLEKFKIKRPPVNVKRIASKLGLTVQMEPFDDEEGEMSGILIREGNKVILGVNNSHHSNRQRFTIAHEIGHYLLHEGDRVFVDRNYRVSLRDSDSSLGTKWEEVEANTFASSLLVPERFLIQDLQKENIDIEDSKKSNGLIKRLAKKYRVSAQAMSFRLNRLY